MRAEGMRQGGDRGPIQTQTKERNVTANKASHRPNILRRRAHFITIKSLNKISTIEGTSTRSKQKAKRTQSALEKQETQATRITWSEGGREGRRGRERRGEKDGREVKEGERMEKRRGANRDEENDKRKAEGVARRKDGQDGTK